MNSSTPTSSYVALREHAAWFDVSTRGKIRVTGDDRARLLHAMTTNQVQQLQPGEGVYAFFLNAQGRILADVDILCFEDHLLLVTEPEQRTKVMEHLDRYIIADDVTIEDITDQVPAFAIEGPEVAEALQALGAELPAEPWAHTAWNGAPLQRTPGGYLVLGSSEPFEVAIPEATADEARSVRIEQGRPRYGEEITDRYLVQETGRMDAVSFTKGCYLGQEIVERVRSRGQVHKHLRTVEIDSPNPPQPGAKLTKDGTEAGEISSAAYSPALGKSIAMAYLKTPFADPGAELVLGQTPARVVGTH